MRAGNQFGPAARHRVKVMVNEQTKPIIRNAMSIDLEDWFCVHNLSGIIKREDWDNCELRVLESTRLILHLLQKHQTRATFFVLGWVADRLPELILEIEEKGHELQCTVITICC